MSDQGNAVVPEEVGNKMDEILNAEPETSEDVTEEAQEDVSAETDTDEEIVEDVVEDTTEETVESEDKTVDASEEAKETEDKVEAKPEPQRKTDDVVRKEEEIEEIKFDLDPDLVDPQVKAALDKAAEVLNKQQKVINEEKKNLQLEREKAFETRVDSCFDSYEKELPRLGSTSNKLTEDNSKYRREIFQYADVTARLHGVPIEDAIKDTVQMFKNKEGEKAIEKRLIAKLQKQKGKFTNPPTRKKSDVNSRKFASEAERVRAKMDEAFKKAGID